MTVSGWRAGGASVEARCSAIAQAMAAWWIRPWADGERRRWVVAGGRDVGVVLALAAPDRLATTTPPVVGRRRARSSWSASGSPPGASPSLGDRPLPRPDHPEPVDDDALVGVGCTEASRPASPAMVYADPTSPPITAVRRRRCRVDRTAVQIRTALGSLAEGTPDPTADELRTALAPWEAHDLRVRTARRVGRPPTTPASRCGPPTTASPVRGRRRPWPYRSAASRRRCLPSRPLTTEGMAQARLGQGATRRR